MILVDVLCTFQKVQHLLNRVKQQGTSEYKNNTFLSMVVQ